MKYIRFRDLGGDWVYAYFIKQENGYFYTVNPICGRWVELIGDSSWFDKMKLSSIDDSYFIHEDLDDYKDTRIEDWMFEFPLKQRDIFHLMYIGIFYEEYLNHRKLSLSRRLEATIHRAGFFLPEELLGRLLSFIIEKHKEDTDRIRVMFSSKIQKYMR